MARIFIDDISFHRVINGEVKKPKVELNRKMFFVLFYVLYLINLMSLRYITRKYNYLFQSLVRQLCRNVIKTFLSVSVVRSLRAAQITLLVSEQGNVPEFLQGTHFISVSVSPNRKIEFADNSSRRSFDRPNSANLIRLTTVMFHLGALRSNLSWKLRGSR